MNVPPVPPPPHEQPPEDIPPGLPQPFKVPLGGFVARPPASHSGTPRDVVPDFFDAADLAPPGPDTRREFDGALQAFQPHAQWIQAKTTRVDSARSEGDTNLRVACTEYIGGQPSMPPHFNDSEVILTVSDQTSSVSFDYLTPVPAAFRAEIDQAVAQLAAEQPTAEGTAWVRAAYADLEIVDTAQRLATTRNLLETSPNPLTEYTDYRLSTMCPNGTAIKAAWTVTADDATRLWQPTRRMESLQVIAPDATRYTYTRSVDGQDQLHIVREANQLPSSIPPNAPYRFQTLGGAVISLPNPEGASPEERLSFRMLQAEVLDAWRAAAQGVTATTELKLAELTAVMKEALASLKPKAP